MKRVILLALFVAFCAISRAHADEAPAALPVAGWRVMSFNIRNSGARDGENQWSNRRELFVSTIQTFDPDLLGLQEVLADQHDQLLAALPAYTAVGVARTDGARKGEWSLIMFRTARFEQLAGGTFWLSEHPDEVGSRTWDAALERICSWVTLRERSTGKEFLYANTHFDHKGSQARLQSAILLRHHLAEMAGQKPIILTGDFNCIEDDAPYRALTSQDSRSEDVWKDSYREVHPERTTDEASFHGFKGGTQGSRIDWILHTGTLKAMAADIVRRQEGGHFPSDHFAVTAILQWP